MQTIGEIVKNLYQKQDEDPTLVSDIEVEGFLDIINDEVMDIQPTDVGVYDELPQAFDATTLEFDISNYVEISDNVEEMEQDTVIKTRQTAKDILGDFNPASIHVSRDLSSDYMDFMTGESPVQHLIAYDAQQFSEHKQYIINTPEDKLPDYDVWALENLRVFPKNAFKDRGFFYSRSAIETMATYEWLRNTSLGNPHNDACYSNRYIYPICLPNGRVFTHMGYSINTMLRSIQDKQNVKVVIGLSDIEETNKYQINASLWVNQGNLLGNLESLSMYDGEIIYCCEGYFDAVRVNTEFNAKSTAILNSTLTRAKLKILNNLKRQGHVLIFIPDMDDAGLSDIIKNPIWDDVYKLPRQGEARYLGKKIDSKDIDGFVKSHYLSKYYADKEVELGAIAPVDHNIHEFAKGSVKIPFYKPGMKAQLGLANRILKGGLC